MIKSSLKELLKSWKGSNIIQFSLQAPNIEIRICTRTNSHDIANEIVQITFIKLWNNRAKLKADVSLSKQIFRIVKNAFVDEYRRNNAKKKIDLNDVKEKLVSHDV